MSEPTFVHLHAPKLRLVYDHQKHEADDAVAQLLPYVSETPEVIAVIGGDGMMLRAIRQHWQDGLPFYGLNTGHLGFLLNEVRVPFWHGQLRRYRLPLLEVEMLTDDGDRRREIAFNDCWIERETGQTAWIEVRINGEIRMPRLIADGLLVASAAGSTSYARAMGASPLPFNANLLTLAGSNVLLPAFWRPAVLPPSSRICLRNLAPDKRPLRGFVDSLARGRIVEMTVAQSTANFVELLFAPEYDPVSKLAITQFPQF